MLASDPLQQLHDIHLPPPIGLWPVAPGWYVLLVAILLLIVFISVKLHHHYKHNHYRRLALKQLQAIHAHYTQQHNITQACIAINRLLRQLVLAYLPNYSHAALHGDAWFAVLDKLGNNQFFCQGLGMQLSNCAYGNSQDINMDQALVTIKQWIKAARWSNGC